MIDKLTPALEARRVAVVAAFRSIPSLALTQALGGPAPPLGFESWLAYADAVEREPGPALHALLCKADGPINIAMMVARGSYRDELERIHLAFDALKDALKAG